MGKEPDIPVIEPNTAIMCSHCFQSLEAGPAYRNKDNQETFYHEDCLLGEQVLYEMENKTLETEPVIIRYHSIIREQI